MANYAGITRTRQKRRKYEPRSINYAEWNELSGDTQDRYTAKIEQFYPSNYSASKSKLIHGKRPIAVKDVVIILEELQPSAEDLLKFLYGDLPLLAIDNSSPQAEGDRLMREMGMGMVK